MKQDIHTMSTGHSSESAPTAAKAAPTSRAPTLWTTRLNRDPRIVRASRAFGGKDRHSKVRTVRGLRDRRVRLSIPTAIQLYDLQHRLGLSQPSKVVDWLLDAAKRGIDELPPLQIPQGFFTHHFQNLLENSRSTRLGHDFSVKDAPAGECSGSGNLNQGFVRNQSPDHCSNSTNLYSFPGTYNNPFVNPNLALICPPPQTLGSPVQIDRDLSSGLNSNSISHPAAVDPQPWIATQPYYPLQIHGSSSSTRTDVFDQRREMMNISSSFPAVYQFTAQPATAAILNPFQFSISTCNSLLHSQKRPEIDQD